MRLRVKVQESWVCVCLCVPVCVCACIRTCMHSFVLPCLCIMCDVYNCASPSGSSPYQLSSQISKLLPACASLLFDHALPPAVATPTQSTLLRGGRKIVGAVSQLGETMELSQVCHRCGLMPRLLGMRLGLH